jgi:ABC-type nitrate/sulfonate/bicarbonate transport system substrate-binding protein
MTTRNGWNLRNLVFLLTLLGSFALLAPAARAADDVSIGMVRLPTAIFIAIDQGFFAAEGLNITDLAAGGALRWQMQQYVTQGLVKTVPDLKSAVDNSFVRGAK